MSASYLGEIRMFGGNFSPQEWAFCDGQLQLIANNQGLFSLIGTTYGGDARSTFALPPMRGRVPIHQGTGPGLTPRAMGQKGGEEDVMLTLDELPPHTHNLNVVTEAPDQNHISNGTFLSKTTIYADEPGSVLQDHLGDQSIGVTGSNTGHTNIMPSLVIDFIICMAGIYPSRS